MDNDALRNKKLNELSPYLRRYRNGEWRALIFRDLILSEIQKYGRNKNLNILDIGCGSGFDGDAQIQAQIAGLANNYIGIEPDKNVIIKSLFTYVHRCMFEDAQIYTESIDIAYSVMVLEHFYHPEIFWEKLYTVLKPGGIFLGFTVDSRHLFARVSLISEKLHIKDLYLDILHGNRGKERYENYPTYYKCNKPDHISKMTMKYKESTIISFNKIGTLEYYLPSNLKWFGQFYDKLGLRFGWPGNIIAVRVVK